MEKVLYVVGNVDYKRGFMRESRASLVITDGRLIVAFLTPELAKKMKKETEGGVRGFLKGITTAYGHWKEYYDMSPDEILGESPENFEIPIREVREVKMKNGDSESGKRDELEVKAGKSYKFYADASTIPIREVKKSLEGLGVRVKDPRFSFI
ncbi:hypothetical protein E3E36_04370 [Thermococcus sp. M36]|uniref:hypothetical protein n=1 Tax=Thermococcus sp. M36 TaxID=1638261 RepID=UPI00143B3901|nr:hypothetical protein [Thermococcus sp. M36]NJE05388.1 hypothetical protein [Thermococcus sp. M36]